MKNKKIGPTLVGCLILIGMSLFSLWLTRTFKNRVYQEGYLDGRASVTLDDVCIDKEQVGVSANFETGEYYESVRCKTNFRDNIRVQDIFEPEGDWDICNDLNEDGDFDDEGECRPAARDSQWVD